jgi:hypothetical protein
MTKEGISPATSDTKSHSPRSITSSTIWRASAWMRSSRRRAAGRVNSERISLRNAVWSGGSIISIIL